jgi:hypothetical protein
VKISCDVGGDGEGVNVRVPMEMATGNLFDTSIVGFDIGVTIRKPLAIFHILSIDLQ